MAPQPRLRLERIKQRDNVLGLRLDCILKVLRISILFDSLRTFFAMSYLVLFQRQTKQVPKHHDAPLPCTADGTYVDLNI